jgi:hypothetical protein
MKMSEEESDMSVLTAPNELGNSQPIGSTNNHVEKVLAE